jgi:erythronate-4-phosphate dehydrogenase
MRIIADENMPLVEALFGSLGEVVRVPGRSITPADVREADVLLVRSVTRVTKQLLEGSRVRFVGTATIGMDHIDMPAMAELGVTVASAPGCNARAVAEYVLSCLALLAQEQGWHPEQRAVGVVGLGNVGRQVVSLLQQAGFRIAGCDPFVQDNATPGLARLTLDEMIECCDILLLHTPLTRSGAHPTFHLLDRERLARLHKGQILLNAGRGEVINNAALLSRLQAEDAPVVALDVWEGEPLVMPDLLDKVRLGSPHVAGYSQEGKWRGTAMVHEAWSRFTGVASGGLSGLSLPTGPVVDCPQTESLLEAVVQLSSIICPVLRDDANLRASLGEADPGLAFDRLRRTYPSRFEFASCTIKGPIPVSLRPALAALGFRMSGD